MNPIISPSGALLRRLEQLDADDEVIATEFVLRHGWRPDCLELARWRKDHRTGYIVANLHDAYMHELKHFGDEEEPKFDA